jgi:hypothetical protein
LDAHELVVTCAVERRIGVILGAQHERLAFGSGDGGGALAHQEACAETGEGADGDNPKEGGPYESGRGETGHDG